MKNFLHATALVVALVSLALNVALAHEHRSLRTRLDELRTRLDELETWRACTLAQGELVWFSPDGPRRVKLGPLPGQVQEIK